MLVGIKDLMHQYSKRWQINIINITGNVMIKAKSAILRGVLLADLFELFVPGGSAIVGFLLEPGDHV